MARPSLSGGGLILRAQFFVAGSIGTNTTKSTWQQQKERRFAASAESRSFPITRCKSIARKSAGSITTDLKRRPTNKDREYRCKACGKPIQPIRHNSRKSYCDEKCRAAYFNNLKFEHAACYVKEAQAILAGKHWEGKNRCVKLRGDD